jgi:hypothetical protein
VQKAAQNPEAGFGSRAELSIEISRAVSRVLSGEKVDTWAEGIELALRFPEAEMSGPMISEAILRAAGMVGMIRDGVTPPPPPVSIRLEQGAGLAEDVREEVHPELPAPPHRSEKRKNGDGRANAPLSVEPALPVSLHPKTADGKVAPLAKGAVAAIRRVFFRDRNFG